MMVAELQSNFQAGKPGEKKVLGRYMIVVFQYKGAIRKKRAESLAGSAVIGEGETVSN